MADGEVALAGALGEVAEAPPVDIEPVDTDVTDVPEPVEGEEPSAAEAAPEPKEEPEVKAAPGKLNPREVTKTLRELRDANPDRAPILRQLNDAFFRAEKYTEAFATPEDAQRAKATFEALGGDEGITSLRQAANQVADIDRMAAEGDPKMIDAWVAESREGFIKAAPVMLDTLERTDQRAYASTLQPHLVKALVGAGLGNSLDRIAWFANRVESPELKQEIAQVQRWLGGLVDEENKRQTQQNDPRMAEIQAGSRKVAEERAGLLNEKVDVQVQPYLRSTIEKALGEHSKGTKLGEKAVSDLRDDVIREIDRTLKADKVYMSNLNALRAKGDIQAIAKYIKTNVDSLRARAVREVWNNRVAPFQSGARAAEPQRRAAAQPAARAAQPRANSAALLLPGKPNIKDLDMDRDPDRQLFIAGRGYLKAGPNAGKLVQWRR
jgi:hypothetical protein